MYTRSQDCIKPTKLNPHWRNKSLRSPHILPTNTTQHSCWFCLSRWKYCYPTDHPAHTWLPAKVPDISWKLQTLPNKDFPKLYWTFSVQFCLTWPFFYIIWILKLVFFPYLAFLCQKKLCLKHIDQLGPLCCILASWGKDCMILH